MKLKTFIPVMIGIFGLSLLLLWIIPGQTAFRNAFSGLTYAVITVVVTFVLFILVTLGSLILGVVIKNGALPVIDEKVDPETEFGNGSRFLIGLGIAIFLGIVNSIVVLALVQPMPLNALYQVFGLVGTWNQFDGQAPFGWAIWGFLSFLMGYYGDLLGKLS